MVVLADELVEESVFGGSSQMIAGAMFGFLKRFINSSVRGIRAQRRRSIMKTILLVAILFAGCTFFSETPNADRMPQLVFRTALPMVPSDWADSHPRLEVLFHISNSGEVIDARFVNSTGNDSWEANALKEMKQWRFSPAHLGPDSISVWVRVPIAVRYTDPKLVFLAQLICTDQTCADSAYRLLEAGRQFDLIGQELTLAGFSAYERIVGETDIHVYSKEVQKELQKLKEDDFTAPIRVGESFVIFKRLADKRASGV